MTSWGIFLGVFTGIFVGVQTNLIIHAIKNYRIHRKMINDLKLEIDFNIKKIESFLKKLKDYQNHIIGDSPYKYFGILKMSGLLKTTLEQMFSDRSIYKYFDYENIGRLQIFMADFQPQTEQKINDAIQQFREIEDVDKMRKTANKFLEYGEMGFNAAKENLEAIKMKKEVTKN